MIKTKNYSIKLFFFQKVLRNRGDQWFVTKCDINLRYVINKKSLIEKKQNFKKTAYPASGNLLEIPNISIKIPALDPIKYRLLNWNWFCWKKHKIRQLQGCNFNTGYIIDQKLIYLYNFCAIFYKWAFKRVLCQITPKFRFRFTKIRWFIVFLFGTLIWLP